MAPIQECGTYIYTDRVKPKTIKFIFVTSQQHTALRRKINDWFARNQENVSISEKVGNKG